ncbi:MAG: tRNA epoxyqueuosine(34) reductase QueG, partial [Bacillota bacterium]
AAVPALARALAEDPKPVVRASAAWALGRIGGDDAYRALLQARERETDPEVRQEIEEALERVQGSRGTPAPPPPPAAPRPRSHAGG